MKYFFVAVLFIIPTLVLAYNPMVVTVAEPFNEISIPMDEQGQQQSYLGVLESYPHLYEFELGANTALQIQTRQRKTQAAEPINLILLSVQPDTERISEIIRSNKPIEERRTNYDSFLGAHLIESDWIELELEAGLYRLEVSSPRNETAYELNFGEKTVDNSYFGTFATIAMVQKHFGYGWVRYFFSTYVLYQLGIIVMVGGFFYLRHRQKNTYAT